MDMSIASEKRLKYEQDEFASLLKVRTLLIMGFASYVIETETNVTQKRIRRIRGELIKNPEFIENINKARSNKHATSRTIIKTCEDQQHATIVMRMYAKLHKDYAINIDIIKLAQAYGHYIATVKSACESIPIYSLTINDAWALAVELREDDAAFILCRNCKTYFYEAFNQSRYQESKPCPWCS